MAEKTQLMVFEENLVATLNEVKDGLPDNFNQTKYVQNATALVVGNQVVKDYVSQYGNIGFKKVILGLKQGAFLNLDFLSKEAYLIPRGSEINFEPSYKGCIKLCKQYATRPVLDIYAKVIREGDEFQEEIIAGEQTINFKPKFPPSKNIIGAFAVCKFKDGGLLYDVMTKDEIEMTRSKSKMRNGATWKDFYSEMCKKVVLRRLCKTIDLNLDTKQREIWEDDMAIATQKEVAENEIEEQANTVEFDIVGDVDITTEEVVE